MYDIEKRRSATNITVGDFCEYLLGNVPADAVFHVGSKSHFYLHADSGNRDAFIDESNLSYYEDCENYREYPIKKIGENL